jgi:acylphosphatase
MWTLHQAQILTISGFVKNRLDGSVYIEAEGSTEKVNELIRLCYQGPPRSEVSEVISTTIPIVRSSGFQIR